MPEVHGEKVSAEEWVCFTAWRLTDPARCWLRIKRSGAEFALARNLPSWLRRVVVVQATMEARNANPDPTGYAGPDGLGYRELFHAAERTPVPGA